MFSFTQIKTVAFAAAASTIVLAFAADANAQNSEFERRAEAMRRARSRQAGVEVVEQADRTAQAAVARVAAKQPATRSAKPVRSAAVGGSRVRSSGPSYRVAQVSAQAPVKRRARTAPPKARVAQNLAPSTIIDGGMVSGGIVHGGMGETIISDGGYVDGGYVESSLGGCDSCGDAGAYFEDSCCGGNACGGQSCCGRGGCAPRDCWLAGLGGVLRNGEYFFGAVGFQEPLYGSPEVGAQLVQDSNFGFYGGINLGVPLCRLTCGVLSGQIGVRSIQSNLNGNQFTDDTRNQLFVTAGLYRRVDYGLQFGVVGDFLQDEFYGDASLSQIRTDLGWVFSGGSTFGFRYTAAQEDDTFPVTFNGTAFTDQSARVHDQYRFYLRTRGAGGGFGELFAGWTEENQTILGVDFDVPLNECIAIESTFTYFLHDEGIPALNTPGFLGSNAEEAWNIAVGFVFRPQGRRYYDNYDRPLFDVADNGTMLIRRD